MAKEEKTMRSKVTEIQDLLDEVVREVEALELKRKKVAATRARKVLQNVIKAARDLRVEIMSFRKEM